MAGESFDRFVEARDSFRQFFETGTDRLKPEWSDCIGVLSNRYPASRHKFFMIGVYLGDIPHRPSTVGHLEEVCSLLDGMRKAQLLSGQVDSDTEDLDRISIGIDHLFDWIQPLILKELVEFKYHLKLDADSVKALPNALNNFEKEEGWRRDRFDQLVSEIEQLGESTKVLAHVKPFVRGEMTANLDRKEAFHILNIALSIIGAIGVLAVMLFGWFGWVQEALNGDRLLPMGSNGTLLDAVIVIKLMGPGLLGLFLIAVLLRCVSLERHNLLMLRQRRVILRMAVEVLTEFPDNEEIRNRVLTSLSHSVFSFYPSGYARRGLEPSAEIIEILKKTNG